METRRHVSLVGPTLLIGLGLILLLNNLGYLDWGVWDVLRLWPILLIAAGLEVLLGRRSIWTSLLAALIVLALIGGSIWIGAAVETADRPSETEAVNYPREEIETASVRLAPAVGDLVVGPLVDSANLIEGAVHLQRGERLSRRFTGGERATLVLESQNVNPAGYVGVGRARLWALDLNPEVELDLAADLGVGEVSLDLTDLQLDDVTVDFGVAQAEIALPNGSDASIIIDGGIGTVILSVDPAVGLRIRDNAGLVTHTLPEDYTRDGDLYTSPGYTTADYQVEVVLGLGIGTFTVEER